MTNEELNDLADAIFLDFIENRQTPFDIDDYKSADITLLFAKVAARFAAYAGDQRDI